MSKKPIKKLADLAKEALDMSKEARMARAEKQGFDTVTTYYHGTRGNIEAFDPAALGATTGAGSARKGFFFASDPGTAGEYAQISDPRSTLEYYHTDKRAIEPISQNRHEWAISNIEHKLKEAAYVSPETHKIRMKDARKNIKFWEQEAAKYDPITAKPWQTTPEKAQEHIRKLKGRIADLKDDLTPEAMAEQKKRVAELQREVTDAKIAKEEDVTQENVLPVHLKYENPLVYDFRGKQYREVKYAELMDRAKAKGHDAVIFKNTYDPAYQHSENPVMQDIVAVFDPSQIRSVNAKFDPKKKGSGNILDSLGPIAVGAAGVGVASQDAEAKPLDMSKVARMKRAEELGFDTAKTYFHGTKGNISEFKVNPDRNGLGVYFSETPETANSYAMGTQFNSTGANVIPANLRQEKVFDIADKFKHEIVNPENKDKFLALFPKSARGPIEAKLREGVLPFGSNVAPAYYLMEQVPEVKKALTDGGYTSLRFNDWLNNKAEPVTVAFNPADIRSTNAAFDPKKKNSAKILAGGAGAATLAASNDALAADLNSPVASGMGEVVSQAGHAMERFDAYTSNPFRKFLNSALEGKGIIQSAREGVAAIGAEKPTTGEEVAKNFLSLSPNQNLGFPTADGGKDYPLAGPLGVAVDFAVDPTNIPMAKAVGPSMDAASSISRIIEQSLLKRGLVLP